jgi:hypothetical protein
MAGPGERGTIAFPRMRKGSWMLEWKARLLTLLVVFVLAADEFVSANNWNW